MLAIDLMCVGDVDGSVVEFVSRKLAGELRGEVTMLGSQPVPQEAFNPKRGQFNSSIILDSPYRPNPADSWSC